MKQEKPIILFDGVCNLCNLSVDFVLKRDRKKQFRFVSLQSDEGRKMVKHYKIPEETDSVILVKNGQVFLESDAAIKIAHMLPAPWNWATIFNAIPLKIRNGIYRWIARNRYRWFGKRKTCRVI